MMMDMVALHQFEKGEGCCHSIYAVFTLKDRLTADKAQRLFAKLIRPTMGRKDNYAYWLTIGDDYTSSPNGRLYRDLCLGLFKELVLERKLYRRLW
jgi:hypothetical protein